MTAIAELETTDVANWRAVNRRRHDLQEAAARAREDLSDQREIVRSLSAELIDERNESAEEQLPAARRRLKELADALEQAEEALSTFNSENLSAKEIEEREAEIVRQEQERQKGIAHDLFRQNIRRRIDTLLTLKTLEDEAQGMFDEFVARFHLPSLGSATPVKVHAGILNFIPATFWSLSAARPLQYGMPGMRYLTAPGQFLGQAFEQIQSFDPAMISPDGTLVPAESGASDGESEPAEDSQL